MTEEEKIKEELTMKIYLMVQEYIKKGISYQYILNALIDEAYGCLIKVNN